MKYQSWMLTTSILVCMNSTSIASQPENFPAPTQQASSSRATDTQMGQETGTRLLARIVKSIDNITSTLNNQTPNATREKLIRLGDELARTTERTKNYIINHSASIFSENHNAPVELVFKVDNILMADSRAFAIRAATILDMEITGSGENFEKKLLYRVLKKIEDMTTPAQTPQNHEYSPQYQEPGPQSQPETATDSPYANLFKDHVHHYQEAAFPQAEPNPIAIGKKIVLTAEEEKQHSVELKKAAQRMNHILQILDPNLTYFMNSTDSERLQSIRQYIRNIIQTEHKNFSPRLGLSEIIKNENIFACHFILSFGMDTASLFGIEILDDTIPYRLKLTNLIFNKIEKILGVR